MTQQHNSRKQVIEELRGKLRDLEASFRPGAGGPADPVPSGIGPLNALLPGGGFRAGSVIEWLAENEGAGAGALAFRAVVPWLREGQTCVVVDDRDEFYPAFLSALGVDLGQVLIVRPAAKDVWWTLEQALRCRGVAVTVGWLGQAPNRILRRLQLAAEAGGGLGIFLRPEQVRAEPAWCQVRLLVQARPAPPGSAARRARITVLYCQGGRGDGSVEVDIHEETNDVRVVASLAPARNARQAT
jgi:hypothetical protein